MEPLYVELFAIPWTQHLVIAQFDYRGRRRQLQFDLTRFAQRRDTAESLHQRLISLCQDHAEKILHFDQGLESAQSWTGMVEVGDDNVAIRLLQVTAAWIQCEYAHLGHWHRLHLDVSEQTMLDFVDAQGITGAGSRFIQESVEKVARSQLCQQRIPYVLIYTFTGSLPMLYHPRETNAPMGGRGPLSHIRPAP